MQEIIKNKFSLETMYDKEEIGPGPESEDWDEADSDEEKDELDIMQEIHIGTRRSTRPTKQPETLHAYMRVDPTALQIKPMKDKRKL